MSCSHDGGCDYFLTLNVLLEFAFFCDCATCHEHVFVNKCSTYICFVFQDGMDEGHDLLADEPSKVTA
jgi:hypothetical protein